MALTTLEQNTISIGCKQAKLLIEQVKPILDGLNAIFDADGGVKSTVTQQNLDAAAFLSGLTVQQLNDGFYALTTTIKGDLNTAITQLAQLAARAT